MIAHFAVFSCSSSMIEPHLFQLIIYNLQYNSKPLCIIWHRSISFWFCEYLLAHEFMHIRPMTQCAASSLILYCEIIESQRANWIEFKQNYNKISDKQSKLSSSAYHTANLKITDANQFGIEWFWLFFFIFSISNCLIDCLWNDQWKKFVMRCNVCIVRQITLFMDTHVDTHTHIHKHTKTLPKLAHLKLAQMEAAEVKCYRHERE